MTDLAVAERTLTDIEASIKGHLATFAQGTLEAADARIAIGHDLREARVRFPANREFGSWCQQQFGKALKNKEWRRLLMLAAENEEATRAALATQVANGNDINFKNAVKASLPRSNGTFRTDRTDTPVVSVGTYPTIVIDPPWQYDNKATRGAAEDHYSTMSLDELEALVVPATDNAHLYLWVTNGFLRQGFDLLDAWGFTYKTTLTWVKPQMGMGNYFRGGTEHVLFGIRGSLPTNAKDILNWFRADRTKHSAKPELFYDIVEKSSPGPWLEMFARRRRFNWEVWGDEA